MPGIFPETAAGGIYIRDPAGNPISSPNVQNAYAPPATFTANCQFTALPSDCTARLEPKQINAIVSEFVSFAECLDYDGPWDCNNPNNVCKAFQSWWTVAYNDIKAYVDSQNALQNSDIASRVLRSGDTMTGMFTLVGDPANPLDAATKQYVDSVFSSYSAAIAGKVNRSGDTMGGILVLSADPTNPMDAATKAYVDAVAAEIPGSAFNKVDRTGDTMSGALVMQITNSSYMMYRSQDGLQSYQVGRSLLATDQHDYYVYNTVSGLAPFYIKGDLIGIGNTDFAIGPTCQVHISYTQPSSPGLLLQKTGTSTNAYMRIQSGNNYAGYLGIESPGGGSILTGSTANAYVLGSNYNIPVQFGINNKVTFTIDYDGDATYGLSGAVGINVPNPAAQLHVLNLGGAYNVPGLYLDKDPQTYNSNYIQINNADDYQMRLGVESAAASEIFTGTKSRAAVFGAWHN